MDPRYLIQLSVIIDKGSISAAARHLPVAQPTLTRNMATLEMQAGTPLFTRSRYGVKSTPVGDALAREGRAILRNLELAREQVSRYHIGLREQVRVAAGPLIGLAVMPEVVDRLTREHPRLALTVTNVGPTLAFSELLDDRHDVVIGPAPNERLLPGIHRSLLAQDRVAIYCSPTHPLAAKDVVTVEDLKRADWLSVGTATTYEREIVDMLHERGVSRIRTQIVLRNDAAILLQLLAKGRHIAALPRLPALALSRQVPLVELVLEDAATVSRNLYLCATQEFANAREFAPFEAVVREVFGRVLAVGAAGDLGEPGAGSIGSR